MIKFCLFQKLIWGIHPKVAFPDFVVVCLLSILVYLGKILCLIQVDKIFFILEGLIEGNLSNIQCRIYVVECSIGPKFSLGLLFNGAKNKPSLFQQNAGKVCRRRPATITLFRGRLEPKVYIALLEKYLF